jgi:hypothetical protein
MTALPGLRKETACGHPPLEGEGRIAEGDPGWGDGEAAFAAALSPPPGPLARADLPRPGGGVRQAVPTI